jgi:hypothetical protein
MCVTGILFFLMSQMLLELLRPQLEHLVTALWRAFGRFIEGSTRVTVQTFRGILWSDFRREVCD